jgi:hypothetical protein
VEVGKGRTVHWRLQAAKFAVSRVKRDKTGKKRKQRELKVDVDAVMEGSPALKPKQSAKGRSARIKAAARPAKKAPNPTQKGRIQGSNEPTLNEKRVLVNICIERGYIKNTPVDPLKFSLSATAPRQISVVEGEKQYKLKNIMEWASKSIKQQWLNFADAKEMQVIFGPQPLMVARRVPYKPLGADGSGDEKAAQGSKGKRYT